MYTSVDPSINTSQGVRSNARPGRTIVVVLYEVSAGVGRDGVVVPVEERLYVGAVTLPVELHGRRVAVGVLSPTARPPHLSSHVESQLQVRAHVEPYSDKFTHNMMNSESRMDNVEWTDFCRILSLFYIHLLFQLQQV